MSKTQDARKSHESVEEELKRLVEKKTFSPIDVAHLTVSFSDFTDRGVIVCSKAVDSLSRILKKCLFDCKNPGLNPSIDAIYEFFEEGSSGESTLSRFIENKGKFSSNSIDNNRDFVEITLDLEILVVNLEALFNEERIKIKKAKVQTALFAKEIG